MLTGAGVLVGATLALSACGGSHKVVTTTDHNPGPVRTALPAPLLKLIHSFSKDSNVTAKRVEVYGPGSRRALVKASSGDLVQKIAAERKGFYVIVLHGHFVAGSHPAGTKAPRGTVETQIWSAKEGVTDTGISNRLPAAVYRLKGPTLVAFGSHIPGPSQAQISATTVSSSRTILDGRVRCTATESVQAGRPLALTFAVRNISNRTVAVPLTGGGLWLIVRAADGTTYDTRVPLRNEIGPLIAAASIAPGTTKKVAWVGKYLRVRWRGPLRVTPGCGTTALPALTVAVKAPRHPPDERTAVADVVAASGHLLDRCRPERAGVAVQGLIYPPSGGTPPMHARCSVSIKNGGNFLRAQVLIVSPPSRRHVHVRQPYVQLTTASTNPTHSPYEASVWEFVVTKDRTVPVAAAEAEATKPGKGRETFWSLMGSHWQKSGDGVCGGTGGSGGQTPMFDFISVCPQ